MGVFLELDLVLFCEICDVDKDDESFDYCLK